MNIHLILGPVLAGKSTYISKNFDPESTVVVRIGKFLRESIGINAMAADASPEACRVTEEWVRLHVEGAIRTANSLQRPLVFDGFPRTPAQARWFLGRLPDFAAAEQTRVVVTRICTPRDILVERAKLRAKKPEELEFDLQRLESTGELAEKTLDAINFACKQYGQHLEIYVKSGNC